MLAAELWDMIRHGRALHGCVCMVWMDVLWLALNCFLVVTYE